MRPAHLSDGYGFDEVETGPVRWSSKNRKFATENRMHPLKIERGVRKRELALGEGISTIGGPHHTLPWWSSFILHIWVY